MNQAVGVLIVDEPVGLGPVLRAFLEHEPSLHTVSEADLPLDGPGIESVVALVFLRENASEADLARITALKNHPRLRVAGGLPEPARRHPAPSARGRYRCGGRPIGDPAGDQRHHRPAWPRRARRTPRPPMSKRPMWRMPEKGSHPARRKSCGFSVPVSATRRWHDASASASAPWRRIGSTFVARPRRAG